MTKTQLFILAALCIAYCSAACDETATPQLAAIAAAKLDIFPFRQHCEGSYYTQQQDGESCPEYWEKVAQLNTLLTEHKCWLSNQYEYIQSRSTSVTLADVVEAFEATKETLGLNAISDGSVEETIIERLATLDSDLSNSYAELIALLEEEERFTSTVELGEVETSLTASIPATLTTLEANVVADVEAKVQTFSDQLSDGSNGDLETVFADAIADAQDAVDDSIDDLAQVSLDQIDETEDLLKKIEMEFYLGLCTDNSIEVPPRYKLDPLITEAIDLTNLRMEQAEADGLASRVNTEFDNYIRIAGRRRDSSDRSRRLQAWLYVSAAYRLIGNNKIAGAC